MAHFASEVKVDWEADPDGLMSHALKVADAARADLEAAGIDDVPLPLFSIGLHGNPELLDIDAETKKLLLTNSISPMPLHKTLVLLSALNQNTDKRYRGYELLALAKTLVHSVSNLHFGPEVGVGPPKQDAAVIAPWIEALRAIADDLRGLPRTGNAPSLVYRADSRQMLSILDPNSVDVVITSPPYPNEKDYTRTTRLESVLLGFIRDKAELRAHKQNLVRSNTRNVYKGDNDDEWVSGHPEIQRISETIEARRIELGKTSGFERLYPKVAKLYFGGMARHLIDLRTILRPGAHLAYVVGDQASYLRVMIRTGELLADIAQSLGYQVLGIDLFRTRLATATKQQLREEVVVLRWPGSL